MFIFLEVRLKLLKITSERLQLFQNLFFGGQGLMHPPLKNHGSPPCCYCYLLAEEEEAGEVGGEDIPYFTLFFGLW